MALRHRYPIEALLRPPVELYSAIAALSAAVVAGLAPWALLMNPVLGLVTAALLGGLGVCRLREAWVILRYQRNLRRLRRYALRADQIPVSPTRLFLGRGFAWSQVHTQRLRDTLRPEAQRYLRPSLAYRWARGCERAWDGRPMLAPVARWLGRDVWWNPVRPAPPVGGRPALHAVEWRERAVCQPLGERVGHTLVLGATRVGKTRLAEILITQDIRRGEVVICFDPKGDPELMCRMYTECRRAGREFYVFHLGYPELSARYNAVGNWQRISEVATRIARQLASGGNAAAFREFAWRFINIVARALVALGQRPDFNLILRYVTNIEPLFLDYWLKYYLPRHGPTGWAAAITAIAGKLNDRNVPAAFRGRDPQVVAVVQYVSERRLFDTVGDGLVSAVRYDRTYFDKITASLLPLLEKLTTGKIAELLAPEYNDLADPRPIFDWMQVIRRNAVVYVGLDALTDPEVSTAVGNACFADLVSVAGLLYKHGAEQGLPDEQHRLPRINLHCDEFNELMGDEFVPLVNKGGGAGIQVTAYTQTLSDIEARLGNRAKAAQVHGNFNTLIMLRVKEYATAELLTRQLPKVDVHQLVQVSGVSDVSSPLGGSGFTSRNEDRITTASAPMIEPSDVMALPKGHGFVLMEGGQLWKVRVPLPSADPDPGMPGSLQELTLHMAREYRTGDQWWTAAGEGRAAPAADTDEGDSQTDSVAATAREDALLGD